MDPVKGYAETGAIMPGEYEQLPPGGYVCRIINAKETKSSSGARMLVLFFDIEEGQFKDFYRRRYDQDTRQEKKWGGTYRQLMEGKSLPFFKGLMTTIEQSNSGYKWNWDEKSLTGKLFGGVFRREEYFNNQKSDYAFYTNCAGVRTVSTIREGIEVPKDKLVDRNAKMFASEEIVSDEELPF